MSNNVKVEAVEDEQGDILFGNTGDAEEEFVVIKAEPRDIDWADDEEHQPEEPESDPLAPSPTRQKEDSRTEPPPPKQNTRQKKTGQRGHRPFACTWKDCSMKFTTKQTLQRHSHLYTGRKPFPCPHEGCEAAYTKARSLWIQSNKHTGQRPFVCSRCGVGLSTPDSFRVHELRHVGKVFAITCPHNGCGLKFHRHSHLREHQAAMHRNGHRDQAETAAEGPDTDVKVKLKLESPS